MVTWYKFTFAVNVTLTSLFYTKWQLQERGTPAPTLSFLDQTEARRAEKVFWRPALPYLGLCVTGPTPLPPPYLKVWIRAVYTNGLC